MFVKSALILTILSLGLSAQAEVVVLPEVAVRTNSSTLEKAQIVAQSGSVSASGTFFSQPRLKLASGLYVAFAVESQIYLPKFICSRVAPAKRFSSAGDEKSHERVRAVLMNDGTFRLAAPGELVGQTTEYILTSIACSSIDA